MSKFNIISKDIPGNEHGKTYNVKYQIENDTNIYDVQLFCLGNYHHGDIEIEMGVDMKYCWLEGSEGYGLHTEEDRAEFLVEFYKFQRGGAYRKTHPINKSKLFEMKEQQKQLREQLNTLESDIRKEELSQKKQILKEYYQDVDMESLDKYVAKVIDTMNMSEDYYISGIEYHMWEGHRMYVYEHKSNKRVKVLVFKDGKITTRNLDEDDMKI